MATVIVEGLPARARTARSKIYVGIALLIAAIVLAGFSPSFYGSVVVGVAHPWIIHVHAAVYVGWLALLITQSVLAARGQIALHRRIGNFGIGYGALVWVLGVIVSVAVPAFHVRAGEWTMDRAVQFLVIPLGDMVLFGGFFAAAVAYRRVPDVHKRFIVLAAVAVMFAAVGRLWFTNDLLTKRLIWFAPVIVAIAHDVVTKRRVHPVYLIGLATMGVGLLRLPFGRTELWHGIGRAILQPFV